MSHCSSCGRPLTGEGRFCAACGAPQADTPLPDTPLSAAQHPAQHPSVVSTGQAPPPVLPRRQPFPGWAVALFVILAISAVSLFALFVLPFLVIGSVFSAVEKGWPAEVHAAEVRAGLRSIETGIEAWRADHASGRYPPAAVVTPEGLGKYVDPWPQDPYSGGPMLPTGARGGYRYTRAADGSSFTLTGHDDAGTPELPFP
jgi:hypothetical protein